MTQLLEVYRAFHGQAFTPILVDDDRDAKVLVEACVAAGARVIEYSMRRADIREMIPWIRKEYPDLFVIAASTIDSEPIVRHMRRRRPHLPTIAELAELKVQGFASAIGWTKETIRTYAPSYLVMPSAMTLNEAFMQVRAGAHFAKINGSLLDVVSQCRSVATFEVIPVLVTGGMTRERMPDAFEAGAIVVAGGFDMMLDGHPPDLDAGRIAETVRRFLETAQKIQGKHYPELATLRDAPDAEWLAALPHWHPF